MTTGYLTRSTHSFAAAFELAAFLLMLGSLIYAFLLGKIERIDAPKMGAIEAQFVSYQPGISFAQR